MEKLLTYSPQIPLRIPTHEAKSGQPLLALSLSTLSQLADETFHITSINETTLSSLV